MNTNALPPSFEDHTSRLHYSNDGHLHVTPQSNPPKSFVVSDGRDQHVELFTMERKIADAFVAGYDYAERTFREALAPVVARLNEARREYGEIEPGVNDDSVLEAERDALEWALATINGALKGGA